MVLEAVMICLDNSEWMRNGDFFPSRDKSQAEAVNTLALGKTNTNIESTVGILVMAKRVRVLMTPGRDLGRLMTAMEEDVKIGGTCNFIAALKTAALALKNRQNKNQAQRIIMFVGSPVDHDKTELVKLGKAFKKNNISIDVINFGAENTTNDNTEKLEALIGAVQTNNSSHLINVPHNAMMNLSDVIVTSPIMQEASAASGPAASGAPAASFVGGVDPNLDPELAMALRLSMEEARQQPSGSPATTVAPAAAGAAANIPEEEDPMLAQAIALSLAADGGDVDMAADAGSKPESMEVSAAKPQSQPQSQPQSTPKPAAQGSAPTSGAATTTAPSGDDDVSAALQDRDFLDALLNSVGVDRRDVQLDDVIGQEQPKDDKSKPKDDKSKPKDDQSKDQGKK